MPAATVDIVIREQGAAAVKAKVGGISNSLKAIGGIARSVAAPIAGIFTIGAIVNAAQKTMEFDKKLAQLAIQAKKTAGEQEAVRKSIMDMSVATGVAREDLIGYLASVTDATGNFQIATDSMEYAAKAAQATGADLSGLGMIVADMSLKFGLGGKAAGDALAVMIEQGDVGRMTLAELARVAPDVMSVAASVGMTGSEGLREMGAFLNVVRQGFGSAEEAATGFRQVMTMLLSPGNDKRLQKMGVALRDPKTGKLRAMGDVFLEVLEKSKGDVQILTQLFGTRGFQAIAPFINKMTQSGEGIEGVRKELEKYRGVVADASDIQKKFGRASESTEVKWEKIKATFVDLADATLLTSTNLNAVAEAAGNLATSLVWASKMIAGMGEGAGAAYLWLKGIKDLLFGGDTGTPAILGDEKAAGTMYGIASLPSGAKLTDDQKAAVDYFYEQGGFKAKGTKLYSDEFYSRGRETIAGMSEGKLANLTSQYGLDTKAAKQGSAGASDLAASWMLENAGKIPEGIKVDVVIHNADGATVEVKDPSGKLKPGKGASAQ